MLKRNIVYTIALAVALPCVGATNIAAQHPHAARAIRGQAFRFALHKEFKDLNHQLEDVKGRKIISGLMGLAGFNPDVHGSAKDHEIFIEGGEIHFVTLRGNVENAVRKVATQCGSFTQDERREALQALRESITKIGACIFSKFQDGKALDTFDVRHPGSVRTVQSYNALLTIIDQTIAQLDAQPLAAQPRVEIKEAPVQQVVRRPAAVQSQKTPVISAPPIKVIPAKDVTTLPKAPATQQKQQPQPQHQAPQKITKTTPEILPTANITPPIVVTSPAIVVPKTPALQQPQAQPQAKPVVAQATIVAAPTSSATSSISSATDVLARTSVLPKIAQLTVINSDVDLYGDQDDQKIAPEIKHPDLTLPEQQPDDFVFEEFIPTDAPTTPVVGTTTATAPQQEKTQPQPTHTTTAPSIAAPSAEAISEAMSLEKELRLLVQEARQTLPFEQIRDLYAEAQIPATSETQLALVLTPEEHVKDFLIPTSDNFSASFKRKLLAGSYATTKDKHDKLLTAFAHEIAQLMQQPKKTTLAANLANLISGKKFIADQQRYSAEIERLSETNDAAIIAKITENNPQHVVSELLAPYCMMLMLPQPTDGTVIKNLGDYIAWYLQYQHQTGLAGCKQEHVDFLIELLNHSGCTKETVEKIEGSIKTYCGEAKRIMGHAKSIASRIKTWCLTGSNVAANTVLSCMVNKWFGGGLFANFMLANFIRGCLPYQLTAGEVIASILLNHWTHGYLS